MAEVITQCDCGQLPALAGSDEEQRKGYQGQRAWLAGQSLPSARHALTERLGTLQHNDFNEGGNQATRDYIAELERFSEPSADRWYEGNLADGCDACGAEAGEECRPMCIGQAAHDDELGESAGCSCCQARSLAGQAYHECARCGHLGKYHVTCNRPLPGTAHEFSEEPDAIYQHLTRAHCSCGWHSGGYSKIAREFWDTHVQTVGAAPQ